MEGEGDVTILWSFGWRRGLREIVDGGRKGGGKMIKLPCIYLSVKREVGNMLEQYIWSIRWYHLFFFVEIRDQLLSHHRPGKVFRRDQRRRL